MKASKPVSRACGRCRPCEGGVPALSGDEIRARLDALPGWTWTADALVRDIRFAGFLETLAFVHAVGWIALGEDHHPDITFGYNTCTVRWSTHAAGGVTENDFICAARTNALLQDAPAEDA
jgi:4a-hydroxytetrahydrobiopterin dehydratase